MARAQFPQGRQRLLLKRIGRYFNFNWNEIARIAGVCERTISDWRSGKYNMTNEALIKLCKISRISCQNR